MNMMMMMITEKNREVDIISYEGAHIINMNGRLCVSTINKTIREQHNNDNHNHTDHTRKEKRKQTGKQNKAKNTKKEGRARDTRITR